MNRDVFKVQRTGTGKTKIPATPVQGKTKENPCKHGRANLSASIGLPAFINIDHLTIEPFIDLLNL
jgi:hypothetical protein